MGNAELLLSSLQPDVREAHYAQQILDATKRGAVLTQQLLAFSRRQTLAPMKLHMDQQLHQLSPLLQTTVSENTKIQFDFSATLWPCRVDPSQLENAILNLTLNARDAMPQGGLVTYKCENRVISDKQSRPNDSSAALQPGQYVALYITDTGIGMEDAIKQRSVEPFFTTKRVGKGTGLGLSMVFGFVQQSGGAFEIDSTPGEGTKVSLYFPRATNQPVQEPVNQAQLHRQSHTQSHAQSGTKAHETVLVVEDNQPLRQLVVHYLEESGYTVLQASGEHDLHQPLAANQPIDLLVSDIVLQGRLTGPEIAQQIISLNANTKILFMTGYSSTVAVGDHPILQKPFSREEFLSAVKSNLTSP